MSKLLIVAYFFPPYGEVGAVRISKFIKYLHKRNWEIDVLTVNEKYYNTINNSYIQDVEGITIHRTKRLPKFIKGINEEGFYWVPILFFSLMWRLLTKRPEVVLFNGGPFYHLAIAPVAKLFGIQYVLDFRDPWVLNPYSKQKDNMISKISRYLEKAIEPYIIRHASNVINVTDQATEIYKDYYKEFRDKFITIPNGYDPDDFEGIDAIKISKFDIVYSGKFGGFRDPRPFLEAFKKHIEYENKTPLDIRFIWVGKEEKEILNIIQELNLDKFIYRTGFISYKENLSYIKGADLCLLIAGNQPYEPTTKVFDYLAFKKTILPILKVEGFLTQLFNELSIKYTYNNTEHIYDFLQNYNTFNGELSDQYNRVNCANQLDRTLMELLDLEKRETSL